MGPWAVRVPEEEEKRRNKEDKERGVCSRGTLAWTVDSAKRADLRYVL